MAAGRYLGRAIAGLIGVLDIEHIVLHGSVTELGEPWLAAVRDEARRRSLGAPVDQDVSIELAPPIGDLVVMGASALLLTAELGMTVGDERTDDARGHRDPRSGHAPDTAGPDPAGDSGRRSHGSTSTTPSSRALSNSSTAATAAVAEPDDQTLLVRSTSAAEDRAAGRRPRGPSSWPAEVRADSHRTRTTPAEAVVEVVERR